MNLMAILCLYVDKMTKSLQKKYRQQTFLYIFGQLNMC